MECHGGNFDAPEVGGGERADDYQERAQTSVRERDAMLQDRLVTRCYGRRSTRLRLSASFSGGERERKRGKQGCLFCEGRYDEKT